jgi:hypothetical protein
MFLPLTYHPQGRSLLFTNRPELIIKETGIVFRAIAFHLIKKAG